jgi:hypothetical protein
VKKRIAAGANTGQLDRRASLGLSGCRKDTSRWKVRSSADSAFLSNEIRKAFPPVQGKNLSFGWLASNQDDVSANLVLRSPFRIRYLTIGVVAN